MKIIVFLVILFGVVYFIQQKFTSVPVEDRYIKTEDMSNPTMQKNGESVVINFSLCKPEKKHFDVAFGSTTIQILGITSKVCKLQYGGEVENPKWDGKLDTTCQVPINQGTLVFQIKNEGIDFSTIKQYCTRE